MAKSSEQPPSAQPPSVAPAQQAADALLQQGLQAIKQKAFPDAISAFERLRAINGPASYQIQAEMGLVRAHHLMGDSATATSLCEALTNHRSSKVRDWAQRYLGLLQSTPHEPSPEPVGQVQAGSGSPDPAATTPEPKSDRSGFTPMTPVGRPTAAVSPPKNPTSSTAQTPPPSGVADSRPSDSSPADQVSTNHLSESASIGSLFHYQQLNQSPFAEQSATIPAEPAPAAAPNEVAPLLSGLQTGDASGQVSLLFRPLPPLQPFKLWAVEGLTGLALFGVIYGLIQSLQSFINDSVQRINGVSPNFPDIYLEGRHIFTIAGLLIALALASPWLLDWLFRRVYGQKNLSPQQLKLSYPDALRTLRRECQQQGWSLPELRLLPIAVPLCFSYGWLPRNQRIVVSQGLMDQLTDAELASLYAYELGHIKLWELPMMSCLGSVLFLTHQAYWRVARWGDRTRQPIVRVLAAVVASLAYALFWVLRKMGLWLSRLRSQYCDRTAIALTRNPQDHGQALIKLTCAIADYIAQQGYTDPLLESLDLLTPVSHQTALSQGSCLNNNAASLATITAWDRQNPYRQWLAWNTPQALLGERLAVLERAGAQWGLASLPEAVPTRLTVRSGITGANYLPTLLMQGAPIVGGLVGLGAAMTLWFFGGIMQAFDGWFFSWLYQDTSVLKGMTYLGIGIGLLLRINPLFPEIRSSTALTNPSLEALLKPTMALPIDSPTIRIQGQLLGRSGLANWLCQDVILQTPSGLIRLHLVDTFGPLGNFLSVLAHPENWVEKPAWVTGWVRRGPALWLDVEQFQLQGKALTVANHPLWTTVLSVVCCLWGIYIIFRGY